MWLPAVALNFFTDWGMRVPSSSPIITKSSVAEIECYALIDTYGGNVPYLDKIARMLGGPFSDDGRSIPIVCVAGRQVT